MNIPNWRTIAPGLVSAGQPAPGQWPQIRAAGLGTVLNLRPDSEQPGLDEAADVAAAGLRYVHLPVAVDDPLDTAVVDTFAVICEREAPHGLLIHCGSGNRVGALVALHAQRVHGASPAEALAAGERAGLTTLAPRVAALLAAH